MSPLKNGNSSCITPVGLIFLNVKVLDQIILSSVPETGFSGWIEET